jgi:hypothetical protein
MPIHCSFHSIVDYFVSNCTSFSFWYSCYMLHRVSKGTHHTDFSNDYASVTSFFLPAIIDNSEYSMG